MAKKLMTKREIKNFIKESMKRKVMSWSAGVVIVKRVTSGEWKFLALKKFNGKYDIAKGIVEDGEKNIECAINIQTRIKCQIGRISLSAKLLKGF